MNRSQFRDPACYLCLAGAVIASLTQEAADAFLDIVVKMKFAFLYLGSYLCSEVNVSSQYLTRSSDENALCTTSNVSRQVTSGNHTNFGFCHDLLNSQNSVKII